MANFIKDTDLLNQIKAYLDSSIDSNRISANYLFSPQENAAYPFTVIYLSTGDEDVEEIDYSGNETVSVSIEIHTPVEKTHTTVERNENTQRLMLATDALREQVMRKTFIDTLRTNLQSSTLRFGGTSRSYGTLAVGAKTFITSTITISIIIYNSYE